MHIRRHHGLLSLLEAFALTFGWKRWMNLVGVYRPNWLAAYNSGTASEMESSRLSYPSGHSAYMFSRRVHFVRLKATNRRVLEGFATAQLRVWCIHTYVVLPKAGGSEITLRCNN